MHAPGRRVSAALLLMAGGIVVLVLIPLATFPFGWQAVYLIYPGFGFIAVGLVMLVLAIRAQRRSQP